MLDARGSQLPTPERVAARAFKAQETPDMQALDYRLRCSLVQVTGCRRGHCAAMCCRDTPRESTGQVLRDAAGWAAALIPGFRPVQRLYANAVGVDIGGLDALASERSLVERCSVNDLRLHQLR